MRTSKILSVAGFFAWLAAIPVPAHAYLDAATGSIMVQALLGAIGGAAFYARTITAKIKSLFRRNEGSTEAETK